MFVQLFPDIQNLKEYSWCQAIAGGITTCVIILALAILVGLGSAALLYEYATRWFNFTAYSWSVMGFLGSGITLNTLFMFEVGAIAKDQNAKIKGIVFNFPIACICIAMFALLMKLAVQSLI